MSRISDTRTRFRNSPNEPVKYRVPLVTYLFAQATSLAQENNVNPKRVARLACPHWLPLRNPAVAILTWFDDTQHM